MPIRYNRSILHQHAGLLYDQADGMVLSYALAYRFASGGPGAMAAGAYRYFVDGGSVAGWMLAGFVTAAVIGFASGWQAGERAAFRMRLQMLRPGESLRARMGRLGQ